MKELLSIFRNRLLDLSASNRSVFLPKAYKGKFSDVMKWDYLSNFSGLEIIKQMLAGKASFKIADVKHMKGEDLEAVLEEAKRIVRTTQLIEEETGSADFFIGWPFVEGVMKNGMPLRAPLAFFPYTIKIIGREVFLEQCIDAEPHWNRSLFLSLSLYEEYSFDKEWLEAPLANIEDSPDRDSRIALIDQLKIQGWNPVFERDFLSSNLFHFLPVKKEELTIQYSAGDYQLKSYAVMGLFPQSASYIHSDYTELKKEFESLDIEHVFSTRFSAVQEHLQNTSLQFSPLPIDGSQENIISEVMSGKSLVVQGPPGSGKTQLICNLIAQFIGKGKKVLVVCQKKAALDVVYNRLNSLDLSPFVSLVHDAVSDKKEVYEKINSQIKLANDYKQQNIHPDTIVLEKEFSRIQTSIARLVEYFSKYKLALYDLSIGGETAHDLYLKSDRTAEIVDLSLEYRSIPANELDANVGNLEQYFFYTTSLGDDLKRQKELNNKFTIGGDDKEFLLALLNNIKEVIEALDSQKNKEEYLMHIPLEYSKEWLLKINEWKQSSLIYKDEIPYKKLELLSDKKINTWEQDIAKSFKSIGNINYIPAQKEVSAWTSILQPQNNSAWSVFIFRFLGWFTQSELWKWASHNKRTWNREALEQTLSKLKAIQLLYDVKEGLSFFNDTESTFEFTVQEFNTHLLYVSQLYKELNESFEIPALAKLLQKSIHFKDRLLKLEKSVINRNDLLQGYYQVWSNNTVDKLFNDEEFRNEWMFFVETKFDIYLGYILLKENTTISLWNSFDKVWSTNMATSKEQIVELWKQSLLRCWIDEKERLSPILKTVSTPEWTLKESELQSLILRRYSISLEFLKIKLKEWVYADIQYNRLNRQVTYRDLTHQVNKKRSVWPLRKVIAQHEDEVLTLLPCWLVSPETASTVFPLHDLFDLVIFDEASQCFVEKAFPTLFRGKQSVIIGDSKQLKPNDLYKVRFKTEEENETIDYEVESLLDFSDRYFPSQMLKGHYRSKSEELIRFSNEHFYNHELRVIPDVVFTNEQQALHYEKVNGLWENNCNKAEAERIVELVKLILNNNAEKSIGIITFNYQQAFLVKELLDASGIKLPENLMVKNIENVQGDERDIIIFSIAYAYNRAGKMVAQFGSLAQDGGENRLNVAVTRAKEQVYLVTSINPQDLHVENHRNRGVLLLKSYMEYVYDHSVKKSLTVEKNELSKNTASKLATFVQENNTNRFTTPHFADLKDIEKKERILFFDDQRYFYSPSVTDWHGYSKIMFKEKGWNVECLSARNFWLDRSLFLKSATKITTS